MRRSVNSTVDEQLHDRMNAVRTAIDETLRNGNLGGLHNELDEDSELRPESDLLQVSDSNGTWVYQSAAIKRYDLPQRIGGQDARRAVTFLAAGAPLRVLATNLWVQGRLYRVQVATRMDEFYEALDRFERRLAMFTPLVLLLAALAGYWTSRRALAPVDAITKSAQRIGIENLTSRLDVPATGDELERLSETLNEMLDRVEFSIKKTSRFTADASHELRTPVTVMRTRAELALRHARTADEYREIIGQLHTELVETSCLIEKLMLLARADAGANSLKFNEVDFASVVRTVLVDSAPLSKAKGITLSADIAQQPVLVRGDAQLLARLCLVLLDNALKYTPAPGQVSISLALSNGFAVLNVCDSGIGIAGEDLPHVFDRFYRADQARSRESGGAGLGLAIGRWIADAHGGSISATSHEGAGASFEVRLPLSMTSDRVLVTP